MTTTIRLPAVLRAKEEHALGTVWEASANRRWPIKELACVRCRQRRVARIHTAGRRLCAAYCERHGDKSFWGKSAFSTRPTLQTETAAWANLKASLPSEENARDSVIGCADDYRVLAHHRRAMRSSNPATGSLAEIAVAPETFQVSPEALVLVADLHGALALILHDEARRFGGLLHISFKGNTGRPSDVTDNTLNSVLVMLDAFKREALGNCQRAQKIQARIIAHALPPSDLNEPRASLVDLIKADLADLDIECGTQMTRQSQSVRVSFQPVEGRVWIKRN